MDAAEGTDLLEELARLPTLAHPVVGPHGERIALYYDITGQNELHVLDVETGALEQWSDGDVPRDARWFVRWGPDGEHIYYHRDEAGNEQNDIYRIDSSGRAEAVVTLDGQSVIYDTDDEYLLFGSNRDGQMNAFRHQFATDEIQKLTDYDRAVRGAALSPDGNQMAYATNETDDFDNLDTYVANADGSDSRILDVGELGAETTPTEWSPTGDRLLLGDNSTDHGRVGVYHLEAAEITWYDDAPFNEDPVGFLPDGEHLIATRDRDATTVPVIYSLEDGTARELDVPAGVARPSRTADRRTLADDRLVFTLTTPTRRPEIVGYDLASEDLAVLLAAEYGPFERDEFTDATYLTVESDGVPKTPAEAVEHAPAEALSIGALLYDPGERPAPLVVNPHGGPRGRDTKSFDLYTQVLTARGYAVLQVNYRGSAGRGREFVERLIDDWGGAEQGDIALATEHVRDTRDWIDDDRIAVFGGSYGGYSTYWQVVQYPALWDAAVAWIGLTDLEAMYETTMPHYRTELMEKYLGTPDQNPELYAERSPINHVDNLSCPVLIVHGENDRRVPIDQARRFRDALEGAGFEAGPDGMFEYHELGEEGHASTDQEQKLRMFRLLDDFLARRLRDR